jgi:hypothetical protein
MAGSAPRSTYTLGIVESLGRHIPKEHHVKVAQIDAQLECCRTAQHLNLPLAELSLELSRLLMIELRCMLLHAKAPRQVSRVECAVVVGIEGAPLNLGERTRTAMPGADSPDRRRMESATCLTRKKALDV